MNGRAALMARGGVLFLIALLAVGYVRFNTGLDRDYANCRMGNDIEACQCRRDGYTAKRNIFTQAPVFGWVMSASEAEMTEHMLSVNAQCGISAWIQT